MSDKYRGMDGAIKTTQLHPADITSAAIDLWDELTTAARRRSRCDYQAPEAWDGFRLFCERRGLDWLDGAGELCPEGCEAFARFEGAWAEAPSFIALCR